MQLSEISTHIKVFYGQRPLTPNDIELFIVSSISPCQQRF